MYALRACSGRPPTQGARRTSSPPPRSPCPRTAPYRCSRTWGPPRATCCSGGTSPSPGDQDADLLLLLLDGRLHHRNQCLQLVDHRVAIGGENIGGCLRVSVERKGLQHVVEVVLPLGGAGLAGL
eukprot:255984-Prymnesium_polylepis.1